MAKLTGRTMVRHPDGQMVLLEEDASLPEWAEGLVGDHLLDAPVEKPEPDPDPEPEPEPEKKTSTASRTKTGS